MQARLGAFAIALVVAASLAGCASRPVPKLMNLRSSSPGPDEFGVLPTKPLEMPKNMADLPTPTPGGSNRTDPTPQADAVAALGGRERAGGGVPASDGALVTRASRYGVTPNIRQDLAAEDLDFRKHHRAKPLYKLFGISSYFRAYKDMALDPYKSLARWRAAGVRTETAPPKSTKKR